MVHSEYIKSLVQSLADVQMCSLTAYNTRLMKYVIQELFSVLHHCIMDNQICIDLVFTTKPAGWNTWLVTSPAHLHTNTTGLRYTTSICRMEFE